MTTPLELLLFQTKLNTSTSIFQKYDDEGYLIEGGGEEYSDDEELNSLYDDDGEDDDESKNDLD